MNARQFEAAFASLDEVNLSEEFRRRAFCLQGVPGFMRGALRTVYRRALEYIRTHRGTAAESRGWKLFLLASRMLLYREKGQTWIDADELERRLLSLRSGSWLDLLRDARAGAPGPGPPPRALDAQDDLERRADVATALGHLGEMSASSRALVSEPLAPGNAATLGVLTDPERRPRVPHEDFAAREEDLHFQPEHAVRLDAKLFIANLRGARKGAAAGPSGTTCEHLRILLDDEQFTAHRRCGCTRPCRSSCRVGWLTSHARARRGPAFCLPTLW